MKRLWLAVLFALLASAARADVVCVSNNMCCQSAGGASATGNNAWTGTNSFIDGNFSIIGSTTASKVAKFEVDGLTAATTRTYTMPDVSDTLAVLGAQSFTGLQTMAAGGRVTVTAGMLLDEDVPLRFSGAQKIVQSSVQTNRALHLEPTNTLGNTVMINEFEDNGFNFALGIQTDPSLCLMSHNQSTTQRGCLSHDGTNFRMSTPNNTGIAFAGGLDLTTLGGGPGGYPAILFSNKLFYFSDISGATDGTKIEVGVQGTLGTGSQMGTIRGATSNGAPGSRGGEMWFSGGHGAADAVPARVVLGADSIGGVALARLTAGATKVLANNTVTALTNATVASNTIAAGLVQYTVEVFDGTDLQVETGSFIYNVTNKAGTIANNVITPAGATGIGVTNSWPVNTRTAGTLAVTWTITAANPAVLSLNANSSLTPSAGYPRVTYELHNLTQQVVAIQ